MLLTERSVNKKKSQNILLEPEIELILLHLFRPPFFSFLRVVIRAT
jgi:hypothetical protein